MRGHRRGPFAIVMLFRNRCTWELAACPSLPLATLPLCQLKALLSGERSSPAHLASYKAWLASRAAEQIRIEARPSFFLEFSGQRSGALTWNVIRRITGWNRLSQKCRNSIPRSLKRERGSS